MKLEEWEEEFDKIAPVTLKVDGLECDLRPVILPIKEFIKKLLKINNMENREERSNEKLDEIDKKLLEFGSLCVKYGQEKQENGDGWDWQGARRELKAFIKKEKEKSLLEGLDMAIGEEKKYHIDKRKVKFCDCKDFDPVCTYKFGSYDKETFCPFCGKKLKVKIHNHKYATKEVDMYNQKREEIIQIKNNLKKEVTK